MRSQHFEQHRHLLASLIKRSRYFFANRAKINCPLETKDHHEIGSRFVEGAAGGAVMIGMPPDTALFRAHFDWRDAVIPVPFDSPEIGVILTELDKNEERLDSIRKNGVVNSLLRNDHVYRWARVIDAVGMAQTEGMKERLSHLRLLAEMVRVEGKANETLRECHSSSLPIYLSEYDREFREPCCPQIKLATQQLG